MDPVQASAARRSNPQSFRFAKHCSVLDLIEGEARSLNLESHLVKFEISQGKYRSFPCA